MLRVTIHEGARTRTIKLEGKIVGPWVEELSRTWHSLAGSLSSKELHLDPRDVDFVDAMGRQLCVRSIRRRTLAAYSIPL
jgi:hypothetical protein